MGFEIAVGKCEAGGHVGLSGKRAVNTGSQVGHIVTMGISQGSGTMALGTLG
jgi:hypothetical protein